MKLYPSLKVLFINQKDTFLYQEAQNKGSHCLSSKFVIAIVIRPIVIKHCSLVSTFMGSYVCVCYNGQA